MSIHAVEEMDDDNLTIFDIEHCLLTGELAQRQKDGETGEQKYLVTGESFSGRVMAVAAKLSITGMVVIITVYIDEE